MKLPSANNDNKTPGTLHLVDVGRNKIVPEERDAVSTILQIVVESYFSVCRRAFPLLHSELTDQLVGNGQFKTRPTLQGQPVLNRLHCGMNRVLKSLDFTSHCGI
jgi:hypothetical protein